MICPTCNQPVPDCPDDPKPLVTFSEPDAHHPYDVIDVSHLYGFASHGRYLRQIPLIIVQPLDTPKEG